MNRRLSREIVMKLFYQMEIHNSFDGSIGREYLEEILGTMDNIDEQYINKMLDIAREKLDIIDRKIEENLENWSIERVSKVDISILRVAAGEILFMEDIPVVVSINEAIELGKKFGTENSPAFINGVLSSFVDSEEKKNG